MKSLVLAYEWCEKIMAGRTVNPDSIRELAAAIDKHFVSRDALEILKTRCDAAIVSIGNNVSVGNHGGMYAMLWGKVQGVKLVLAYLAEMEATE